LSIAGVGTDIVSKSRIAKVLAQNQQRFLQRILNPEELLQLPADKHQLINFMS